MALNHRIVQVAFDFLRGCRVRPGFYIAVQTAEFAVKLFPCVASGMGFPFGLGV